MYDFVEQPGDISAFPPRLRNSVLFIPDSPSLDAQAQKYLWWHSLTAILPQHTG